MPFPEFESGKKKLVVFTRGRGRGHAIPDMEIMRRVLALCPDVEVRFVSYGAGARAIEEFGWPLIDVALPEANGTAETTIVAGKLIGWLRPDLVIAHEEFAAIPAASIFDVPAVCITDWFIDPEKYTMQALRFAERVLFLEARGVFPEPAFLRGKVSYVGPVVRDFEYARKDRARARRELGLADDATVVSVLPGSWTEEQAPVADLVRDAMRMVRAHVVWVAGDDRKAVRGLPNATVVGTEWQIDRVMAASDLAITKGSRGIAVELAALGIRSIALTHGLNEMDDHRTQPLDARTVTSRAFARAINAALAQPPPRPKRFTGAQRAAAWIARRIGACTDRS